MLNKKADGGLTAIVIILIAVVFLGWLINLGNKECNSNKDCKEDSYCGSDFNCHEFPVIEKTTVVNKISFTTPLVITCMTIIILAIILRWDRIFSREPKISAEKPETYYESQVEHIAK